MACPPKKIVAIVVTFEPNVLSICSTLGNLIKQVDALVVVDNTPSGAAGLADYCQKSENLYLISFGENMGIAYAHNKGLEWAQELQAEYALLLDQDSVPTQDMVKILRNHFESSKQIGLITAAVGPMLVDSNAGFCWHFVGKRFGHPYRHTPNINNFQHDFFEVNFLISSGSLISMEAINSLGGMRSDYFIDHVDTEWSLRARNAGYKLLGSQKASMFHSIGDDVKKLWFFKDRFIPFHSPLRNYYMFRNMLLMLRDIKISFSEKIFLISRQVLLATYFLIFAPERKKRLFLISIGFFHGLKRVNGKFNAETNTCKKIIKTTLDLI
jgi:rhamnosyltransferase